MNLRVYASGSGALNFCWETLKMVGGRNRPAADDRPVTREEAMSMLKPDYELVNEHTEAKPQWAQARIVTRRGGALILDNTVYAIQPGAEDEPTRFLFRDAEEQEQELKNFFILGALRYYLRNEGRILAQRAGTQSKPAGA